MALHSNTKKGDSMNFAGFADEAGVNINTQIAALTELHWHGIETRQVGQGLHFDDVDDATFKSIKEKLDAAGIGIVSYGSQIANWARKITADFKLDVDELKRIIPRMHATGTKIARIMSYPNDNLPEKEWRVETIRRLKELVRIAADNGVVLAHENCSGFGSTVERTLVLLSELQSPAFKLIFDTGNPLHHGDQVMPFYEAVKHEVIHIHIKDYTTDASQKDGIRATFPGEGNGCIHTIVSQLKKAGYNGWFTMEPHIASVIHEGKTDNRAKEMYDTFVKYGRIFEALYEKA